MVSDLTDIDVCNRMLAKIGGGTIQSFEEDSDLAALCARIYPGIRDSLLSLHPWNFVKNKRQLAKSAEETPVNEWQNAFVLPSNMLFGPLAVWGDNETRPSNNYDIYKNFLYCNYETVMIDYTARPDESAWPPWFTEFVATAGAAELAVPVSDQVSKKEALDVKAFGTPGDGGRGGLFAQCRTLNAQVRPTQGLFQNGDPITSARFR